MDQLISEELRGDEKVLWQGQPDPSITFTKMDTFLVPFSLLWGGSAIFWELSALGITVLNGKKVGAAGAIFPLFGIPLVVIGLYFIFGRFIVKRKKKARTWYAVTSKRVIIATDFMGQKVESVKISSLGSISKSIRSDGFGTITFGNAPMIAGMYANSGKDFFGGFYGAAAPTSFDIKNAAEVYKIVQDQRKGAA
jgi:hypothetical protein